MVQVLARDNDCCGVVDHHLLREGRARENRIGLLSLQRLVNGFGQKAIVFEIEAFRGVAKEEARSDEVFVLEQPVRNLTERRHHNNAREGDSSTYQLGRKS